VGKEKKSVNTELIDNTIAYSMMSAWAVIGSFFLFYFTFIFAGLFLVNESISFQNPSLFFSVGFLGIALLTCFVGLKHGFQLYTNWRRKLAIEAEDRRILRLVDDSRVLEAEYEQEELCEKLLK
jgi:hypothetical protein